MKRLSLRRNHAFDAFQQDEDQTAPKLRVVTEPAPIISWPYAPASVDDEADSSTAAPDQPNIKVTADIRTKRFADRRVEEERYSAILDAADGSPMSVLSALMEAFALVDEFKTPGEPGRPMILELHLRA